MAKLLKGDTLSEAVAERLKRRIARGKKRPLLVIIQVGDFAESNVYVGRKKKFATKIGAQVRHKKFSKNISASDLIAEIRRDNADPLVHGIMVQLPLPPRLNAEEIVRAIAPEKDVDGLTGRLYMPATARGILLLLDHYKINPRGKKVTVVGASHLVGLPAALALTSRGATVTICHEHTKNLTEETRASNIVVVAVGKPNLITKAHVSDDQTIIDAGINIMGKRKIVGDVSHEAARVVKAITPVPGGVGPMTIAALFTNLVEAS